MGRVGLVGRRPRDQQSGRSTRAISSRPDSGLRVLR